MSPVNNYVKDIAAGFFNKGLHLNQALCPRFHYERLEHHQFLHITFYHTVLTLNLPAATLLFASHKFLHVVEAPKPMTLTLPLFFSMHFLNFQWKTKKNVWILLKLFEKWLTQKVRKFRMVFNFFDLTLSVPEKLKNSISEIPIIPQTLNINNQRTTSAKSINLHIIKNFIFVKSMFTLTVFEILLFEVKSL